MFACNAKRFAIAIHFFSFPYTQRYFWKDWQKFFSKFCQLFLWTCVTKIGSPSLDTSTKYGVYVLKFCMCGHGIPCALEINSNGGSK